MPLSRNSLRNILFIHVAREASPSLRACSSNICQRLAHQQRVERAINFTVPATIIFSGSGINIP